MRIITSFVVIVLSGTPTLAAPAQTGQTCLIRGEVLEVSERAVARDPDWAGSWGIPRTTRYTDLTIRPIEIAHLQDGVDPSCSGEVQIFQLGEGAAPEVGTCVSATARFSGDEFRIGTWVTGISPAPCG